jgi:hypothetical protein
MLSRRLIWERMPPGAVRAGEQSAKQLLPGTETAPGEVSAPLEHQNRFLLPGT